LIILVYVYKGEKWKGENNNKKRYKVSFECFDRKYNIYTLNYVQFEKYFLLPGIIFRK
jgi:hypothetical protein